jgi:UDP:flavonoid glycosyltransferase YjiC (YdhE family)
LKRRTVTAAALATQIRRVLGSPSMVDKARVVASKMKTENGVAAAVREIGQRFGHATASAK